MTNKYSQQENKTGKPVVKWEESEQRREKFFELIDAIKLEYGIHSSLPLDSLIHEIMRWCYEQGSQTISQELDNQRKMIVRELERIKTSVPCSFCADCSAYCDCWCHADYSINQGIDQAINLIRKRKGV